MNRQAEEIRMQVRGGRFNADDDVWVVLDII